MGRKGGDGRESEGGDRAMGTKSGPEGTQGRSLHLRLSIEGLPRFHRALVRCGTSMVGICV